jgi:predicted HTH transcriptional regulator
LLQGGYIDSWGRGTLKIINACREAELPEPSITEQFGGILVEIFKNRYTPKQLKKSGLNERQLMAGGVCQRKRKHYKLQVSNHLPRVKIHGDPRYKGA